MKNVVDLFFTIKFTGKLELKENSVRNRARVTGGQEDLDFRLLEEQVLRPKLRPKYQATFLWPLIANIATISNLIELSCVALHIPLDQ